VFQNQDKTLKSGNEKYPMTLCYCAIQTIDDLGVYNLIRVWATLENMKAITDQFKVLIPNSVIYGFSSVIIFRVISLLKPLSELISL
jgi:hypothetical protein